MHNYIEIQGIMKNSKGVQKSAKGTSYLNGFIQVYEDVDGKKAGFWSKGFVAFGEAAEILGKSENDDEIIIGGRMENRQNQADKTWADQLIVEKVLTKAEHTPTNRKTFKPKSTPKPEPTPLPDLDDDLPF
jgi:hypothetical protein